MSKYWQRIFLAIFFFSFGPIFPILDFYRRSSSSSCLNIFSLIVIVKCSLKSNISISICFPLPQFLLTEPRSIPKREENVRKNLKDNGSFAHPLSFVQLLFQRLGRRHPLTTWRIFFGIFNFALFAPVMVKWLVKRLINVTQRSGWSCFLSNPIHHNFLSDGFCKTQQLPTNTFGFIWDIFWSLLRIPPYLINVARLLPKAVFKFWTKKFFRSLRVLIRGFHLRGIPMEALQYASPHSNLHKTEGNGKELRIGGNNFP